jgi:hypothetical protein
LSDLSIDYPVFIPLDFAAVIVLMSKVISPVPTPDLEDQTSVFMPHSDRVAQLYPQALGSSFFTFYNSQGYDRSILVHLHTINVFLQRA